MTITARPSLIKNTVKCKALPNKFVSGDGVYRGLHWGKEPLGGGWGSTPVALPGVTLGFQECLLLHLDTHCNAPAQPETDVSLPALHTC